jgi:hypothetical protein
LLEQPGFFIGGPDEGPPTVESEAILPGSAPVVQFRSGDRWPIPVKPFFANGFATCLAVARCSICAAIVIAGSATAVRPAGNNPAASSVSPPTAAINEAPKAVSIIAIVSVNTANGSPKPA